MEAFEALSRLDRLEAGWDRVRRNGGGPGGDGVTIAAFAVRVGDRLLRLHRDLRSGLYRPGPPRSVAIPKRSGGTRPLSIPSIADRVVMTAAAQVLGPLLESEMEDSSFAYRPGRSVQMAVARVGRHYREGYRWVVDGDIERYFENVPHRPLLDRLEALLQDEATLDLIAGWLAHFDPDGRGLPQGAPISPLLANIYLDTVDEAIEGRGVRLVRFADDFLLLCRSEARAEGALERMAGLLAEQGLRLHPEKTRIVPFERGFRFLGHLFVRSLVTKALQEEAEAAPEGARRPASEAPTAGLSPPEPAVAGPALPVVEPPVSGPPVSGPPDLRLLARDLGRAPGLRVLYLTEPGRRLERRNEGFTVTEAGEELLALPPGRVDRIELGPGAIAGDAALRLALEQAILIAYVDGRGATLGLLARPGEDHGGLHLAQARHALEPATRLGLARILVAGRLANQRVLLRRLNRRRKDAEVAEAARRIGRTERKLDGAAAVEVLMGIEGEAAALYWPALGRCLEHGWRLELRRRRPPPDPVNLALSFLASLLARDIEALARRRGLHCGFAALHSARDGHPALVSDLIEEFRAPLVEGLAVYLFNNRILKPEMFAPNEDGGLRIDGEGHRAVVRSYEAWLARPVASPRGGGRVAWRRLLEEQAGAYARHVLGEEVYAPYAMDH